MQEFSKFLANYWQIIVSVILMIISTVFALIRKRPLSSIAFEIYELVIKAVKIVEASDVIGAEQKKSTAIGIVLDQIKNMYPKVQENRYVKFIDQAIEDVLSTPSKKGGK